jgi:hypothetical protein
VSLRLKLQIGTLIVATIKTMTRVYPFESLKECVTASLLRSTLRATMSFLTSPVSWCPAVPLPLGDPFAAPSAVADATFQAELGASASRNGRHGKHDRSNAQSSAKPFVGLTVMACAITSGELFPPPLALLLLG